MAKEVLSGAKWALMVLTMIALVPAISVIVNADQDISTEVPADKLVVDLNESDGRFIENKGQWNEAVRFRADASFGSVSLCDDGVYYQIRDTISKTSEGVQEGNVVKVSFLGSEGAAVHGRSPFETRYNYLFGNDPNLWATDAMCYGSIVYEGLWPGIDLIYHSEGGRTKYDLVLDPWADPSDIRFGVEGVQGLIVKDGSLRMVVDDRTCLTDSSLVAFYEGGSDHIGASFTVQGNSFGFDLQGYDASRTVVIDPEVNLNAANFSTYIGGSGTDTPEGIDIGPNGDVFVCGYTQAEDFPVTPGAYQVSKAEGWMTAFVLKLSPDGRTMKYCTYIGGSAGDVASDIRATLTDSVLLVGYTGSTDFPVTDGAYDDDHNGGYDDFVLELGPTGSTLKFSTYIGGEQDEGPPEMDVDGGGNIYVISNTNSTRFPVTVNAYQTSLTSDQPMDKRDLCLFVLDPSEMDLKYSTYLGGNDWEYHSDIVCGENGEVYIGGYTCSSDFDITASAYSTSLKGPWDGFLFKMDTSNGDLIFSTYFGGSKFDAVLGLDVDRSGNVYACGQTTSTDFPVTGSALDRKLDGEVDGFVTVLNGSGRSLDSSSYIGGSDFDSLSSLELDGSGNVHAVGETCSTDLPVQYKAFQTENAGNGDSMYIKMDGDVGSLLYSTYLGGSSREGASSATLVTLDTSDGTPVVTSSTHSSNFPVTPGSYDTSFDIMTSDNEIFVTKLYPELPPGLPVIGSVVSGDSFVNLSWDIPVQQSGIIVIDYEVLRGTVSGLLEVIDRSDGRQCYNDTTVMNGGTYIYAVRGINDMGPGLTSMEVSARPGARPSVPRNLSGEHGASTVVLKWDGPESDGGWKVQYYTLVKMNTSSGKVSVMDDLKLTAITDREVMNGIAYEYSVTAVNEMGRSDPSGIVTVTPMAVPGAPVGLEAVYGPGYTLLSWAPPVSNGGSPLTLFRIFRSIEDEWEPLKETDPSTFTWNDTGLTNGMAYGYRVTALNIEGESGPSNEVRSYPLDVPSCPIDVSAEPSDGAITVTWKEPASNGGSPVTGYSVYKAGSGQWTKVQENDENDLIFSDRSVENGKEYSYRISARNMVGESPMSVEVGSTPMGLPSPPKGLRTVAGDHCVLLSWDVPYDGGSKILSYTVLRQDPMTGFEPYAEVKGGICCFNDTNVVNGLMYHYKVGALNSVGESGLSDEAKAVPAGLSDPPFGLELFRLTVGVQLEWELPSYTGGLGLSSVRIYRGTTSAGLAMLAEVGKNVRSYEDGAVEHGVAYYYGLRSVTPAGEGPMSDIVSIVPATFPDAPQDLSAREVDGIVLLSWTSPANNGGSMVERFDIYRLAPNDQWKKVAHISYAELNWSDDNVTGGLTYSYKVRAMNEVGEGAFSAEVSVEVIEAEREEGTDGGNLVLYLSILSVIVLAIVVTGFLLVKMVRSRMSRRQEEGMVGPIEGR